MKSLHEFHQQQLQQQDDPPEQLSQEEVPLVHEALHSQLPVDDWQQLTQQEVDVVVEAEAPPAPPPEAPFPPSVVVGVDGVPPTEPPWVPWALPPAPWPSPVVEDGDCSVALGTAGVEGVSPVVLGADESNQPYLVPTTGTAIAVAVTVVPPRE